MRCLAILLLFYVVYAEQPAEYSPAAGDILIQSFPPGDLTNAIQSCTNSVYSHCGIVELKDGKWLVIEAVGPVKETPLAMWTKRGVHGEILALRFKDKYTPKIPEFIASAHSYLGRPYDMKMEMDDEKIYCSELVYKAFTNVYHEDIGKTQRLGDLNWKPNEKFITSVEKGPVPLDRIMITPRAIAESDKMAVVFTSYK